MNEIFKNQDLKLMQAVARGAENIFEDEGQDILRILRDQKKEYLYAGMDVLGAALRFLRRQLEEKLENERHEKEAQREK